MSDGKTKAVPQTTLKIEVSHAKQNNEIDFNKKYFVEIKARYKDNQKHETNGVLATYSLNDLKERLNTYKRQNGYKKHDNPAILKGIYTKGTKGEYCEKTSPFLFFDIDVKNDDKKKENLVLFDEVKNIKAYNELEKIALLVWRSNSVKGIAGVLYVPQIVEFNNETRSKHKKVAESIYTYLSKYLLKKTGIPIKLDDPQGTFRQIRYLADQKGDIRTLNPDAIQFNYNLTETALKTASGVQKYFHKDRSYSYGSVPQQFNDKNNIVEILQSFNYQILVNNRVKSPQTRSKDSGEITKDNTLVNYSSSSGNKTVYTPYSFVLEHQYNNDFKRFYEDLNKQGYKEKQLDNKAFRTTENELNRRLKDAKNSKEVGELIFEYCFDLKTQSLKSKLEFIKRVNPKPEFKKYFVEYLELSENNEIIFDEYHEIKRFVSEKFETILNVADRNKELLVYAETGTGKTTAIFKHFKDLRPEKRCLVLAPLTIIVNQLQKDHQNEAIFLTGESLHNEHKEALESQIVVATYEQGIKHLKENAFDYVFIDEVHQLITANAYKEETIKEATQNLIGKKIIGLTGTPQQIFKDLGFTLMSLTRPDQKKTKVCLRYWNVLPYKIIVNHLRNVKGKALFKLDEKNTIEQIKKELVERGNYKENEILVLKSTRKIKNSNDFKILANERKFKDEVKIILTTSLINEGLSIEQKEFSDIVFIENSYNPRPEPIKQFFARFRNEDPNRTNYLYLKHYKEPKKSSSFNIELNYQTKKKILLDELKDLDYNERLSSYNDLTDPRAFLYESNQINPFYLAYNVTECFFKSINEVQFKNFLELNYNLKINIDEVFNTDRNKGLDIDTSAHNEANKQLKKKIAEIIFNSFNEALDVVLSNTQNKTIKKHFMFRNIEVEPQLYKFIDEQIKDFEYLISKHLKLKEFGINDPKALIKENQNGITIKAKNELNKELFNLKLKKLIFEPKTKTDRKNRDKLLTFAIRMKEKKEFSYKQMMHELKKLKIVNFDSYKKQTCFLVFEYFNLGVLEDKTGLIKLIEKGG